MYFEQRVAKRAARLVRNTIGLSVFLLCPWTAAGQEQSNFTSFYLNPYVLNSSYAGLDGQPAVSFLYRKQWMTIDGAPAITNLSLHAPLNERVSAGININNDSKAFFNNSALLFSAAYHIPLQPHTFLRFGLSVGGSWNTVDMKKLEAVNDPALTSVLDKNASLAGNAGVSFHHKTFNIGVALPSIFSPAFVSEDAFNVKQVKPFHAITVHATNRFYFNDNKNIFEPYILYHVNQAWPAQFELAGIVHLNHTVWAGASYRQYFGFSALGGIKLKQMFAIGASYSIPQSDTDELNSPSFEIGINYLFGQRRRNAPVYSFVNDTKPKEKAAKQPANGALTAYQKRVQAEQKRKADAANIKAVQDEKQRAEAARLAAEQDQKNRRIASEREAKARAAQAQKDKTANEKLTDNAIAGQQVTAPEHAGAPQIPAVIKAERITSVEPEPVERDEKSSRGVDEQVPEVTKVSAENIAREETRNDEQESNQHASGKDGSQEVAVLTPLHEGEEIGVPVEIADNSQGITEEIDSNAVRHEKVKRGAHPQELAAGEYVVAGAFKSIENAVHFSNGLQNLSYNSHHGYLSEKGLWYVYLLRTNDFQQAKAEHQKASQVFLLRDAWLLTVD